MDELMKAIAEFDRLFRKAKSTADFRRLHTARLRVEELEAPFLEEMYERGLLREAA